MTRPGKQWPEGKSHTGCFRKQNFIGTKPCSFLFCPWVLPSAVAELRNCNRLNGLQNLKNYHLYYIYLPTRYLHKKSLPIPSDYFSHIPLTLLSCPFLKLSMRQRYCRGPPVFPYPEYYYSEYTPEEDRKLLEGATSLILYYSKFNPTILVHSRHSKNS